MMPHFDATITLGSLISAVSVIGSGVVFFVRLGEVQKVQIALLEVLREEFKEHEQKDDSRFDRLEQRIIDLVSGLQRLIGQSEVFRRNPRG